MSDLIKITAPKHFHDTMKNIESPYPSLGIRSSFSSNFTYLIQDALAKLGFKEPSIGGNGHFIKKEKHYASSGAEFIMPYVSAESYYEIILPKDKQKVLADGLTVAFLVSFMVYNEAYNRIDEKGWNMSHADEIKLERISNCRYQLKSELLEYEMVMTDDEKQYAEVMAPIIKSIY